jgi:hypothetical protein
MGGRQPLEPRKLPPAISDVPFVPATCRHSERTVAVAAAILSLCQPPDPWPYTFTGGLQPLDNHNLSAVFESVPVNNPPFSPVTDIIDPWYGDPPLPTLPSKLVPIAAPPAADNPPFGLLETIVDPWLGDPPSPTLPKKLVPIPPPAAQVPYSNQATLIAVVASWQSPDPLPTLIIKLPPSISTTVPAPAVHPSRLPVTNVEVATWQPPDPLPTLSGKLSPGIPGQSVDNPPFAHEGRSNWLPPILALAWQPPDPLPTLNGKVPLVTEGPPPVVYQGRRVWVNPILAAWQPPDPLPTLPVKLIPPGPSAPAIHPGRLPQTVSEVLAWQPPDPLPTLAGKVTPPSESPPQAVHPGRRPTTAAILVSAWQPPDPLPTLNVKLVQPFVPPSAFLPSRRFDVSLLFTWQPPDPLPTLAPKLAPSLLDVPVNNPPFSPVVDIVDPWFGDPLAPTLPRKLIPVTAAPSADNPPFGLLETIVEPWISDQPLPTLQKKFVQPFVPPSAYNPHVDTWSVAVAVWNIPPPPQPALPIRSADIPGWSVDNPPGVEPIDILYIDPPYVPILPIRSAPIPGWSVDNPPGSVLAEGYAIDPPYYPILPRNLPPSITTNVPPNAVHPGRLQVRITEALTWQPPDPLPTLPEKVVQPGAAFVVNNPTPNADQLVNLTEVLATWNPDVVHNYIHRAGQPYDFLKLPASITAVPFVPATAIHHGRLPIANVEVASWQPVDPLPTLSVKLVTSAVRVPYAPAWLPTVLTSWIPPDPLPTLPRNLAPGVPGQSVDNPPFVHRGRLPLSVQVYWTWLPPDPLPTLPVKYTIAIDNPPFVYVGRRVWVPIVRSTWRDVDDPLPILTVKLPPSLSAVRVDNPPFAGGARVPLPVLIGWLPPDPMFIVGRTALPAYQFSILFDPRFWTYPQPRVQVSYGEPRIQVAKDKPKVRVSYVVKPGQG